MCSLYIFAVTKVDERTKQNFNLFASVHVRIVRRMECIRKDFSLARMCSLPKYGYYGYDRQNNNNCMHPRQSHTKCHKLHEQRFLFNTRYDRKTTNFSGCTKMRLHCVLYVLPHLQNSKCCSHRHCRCRCSRRRHRRHTVVILQTLANLE